MKKTKHLLLLSLGLISYNLNAQFGINPGTFCGRTIPATIDAVGIGTFPNGVGTNARFHINEFYLTGSTFFPNGTLFRTDGNETVVNQWQMFTGANAGNASEKGKIFTDPLAPTQQGLYNPGVVNSSDNHFNMQSTNGDIVFWAKGASSASPFGGENLPLSPRMRISAANYIDPAMPNLGAYPTTRVGIFSGFRYVLGGYNFLTDPLAMLHIGDAGLFSQRGHRSWMNYGVYVQRFSDNMYFGLKTNEKTPDINRQDAVINWADNNANTGEGPDVLRFIFTGIYNVNAPLGDPSNQNGLEIMRLVPAKNTIADAKVGIGDFSGNNPLYPSSVPSRRLEIFSDKTTANGFSTPQIRVTYSQELGGLVPQGIFSDLQTTKLGDFAILNTNIALINATTPDINEEERFVGINTNTPNNTLEINSQYAASTTPNAQPQDPTIGIAPTGWAGLRFTDLNSTSVAQLNPTNKILSVNANGDVILVTDKVGTGGGGGTFVGSQNGLNNVPNANNPNGRVVLGQDFGQGNNPAQLINDREIPLGGKKLWLNSVSGGNFIVGPNANNISTNQNSIFGSNNTIATFGNNFVVGSNNNTNHTNIKILGNTNNLNGNGDIAIGNQNSIGVNTPGANNYVVGGINVVEGSSNQVFGYDNRITVDPLYGFTPTVSHIFGNRNFAYGGNSIVIGNKVVGAPSGDFVSIGNHNGNPTSAINSYFAANAGGGFTIIQNAHLDPVLSSNDYIPAININAINRVGIKKYYATTALDVAGTVTCTGFTNTSDSTLKTNIQALTFNASSKLAKFRTVSFEWIAKADTAMFGTQYGFTAQQIESVMPELVKTGNDGIKTINYGQVIPLLVKSNQEQQSTIDSMRIMMTQMATMLNSCCQNTNTRTQTTANNTVIDVELSDKDIIVLNQNVPNPFAEQTTIAYNVPEKSGFAQIIFNDMKGQIIKVVDIKTKGKGQLNVFANDLSTGMYTYSLYVDGKLIDTKKMVKTE